MQPRPRQPHGHAVKARACCRGQGHPMGMQRRARGGLTSGRNGAKSFDEMGGLERGGGRDESKRHKAESQWIVAARPLCHLQYLVAYLSRLQRILPVARWELYFKAAHAARPPGGVLRPKTCASWGPKGPYCRSAIGRRAHASLLARILT
ncbi:hypothetical protein CMV_027086 [Castanea mollissima]|uniref:Uncharacterized protein n=1 Tax=Castanea mollissima TaxID=60419 RepID=A0A8J4QA91_9ROSI|nr:hypothetical protein CMV_027086 [Castanea mollissima]